MPAEISVTGWRLLRAMADLVCGLLALLGAFWIRILVPVPFTESLLPVNRLDFVALALPVVMALQVPLLYFLGFYELPHPRGNNDRLRRLVTAVGLQGLIAVAFFFLAGEEFPRTVLILFIAFNVVLLLLSRQLLDRLVATPRRKVAIIGTGMKAIQLAQDIAKYPWFGVEIVGHVPAPGDLGDGPGPLLGSIDDVGTLIASGTVQQVLIAHDQPSWQTTLVETLATNEASSSLLLLPNPFESLLGRTRFRSVHDIPLIELSARREWTGHELLKRGFDVFCSVTLLVLCSPIFLVAAIVIRATSKGPALYSQERVGRYQRRFVLWKLRTMRHDAESNGEAMATLNDPRKTAVGNILRATRIDEIPQLVNVLKGDMSLVGPRPERPGFVAEFLDEIPGYAARFATRPGVTGLAQVNGEYQSTAVNKLRYDLAYISNGSLWLDVTILIRTIRTVLTSRGV